MGDCRLAVVGFGADIAAWFALGSPAEWRAFLHLASALALVGFALASGSMPFASAISITRDRTA